MPPAALEAAPPPVAVAAAPRELTARALLFGAALGAVLAAGNVYTALKTSFIDGGSITAALLGFAFFGTFKRFAGTPYTSLENNIAQTTASSAGIMGFAVGFPGAIPALNLLGYSYPGWALAIWGIAIGLFGIVIGGMLRRKLVLIERLPFPTGAATAEVIETIGASRKTAMYRARLLVSAAVLSMAFAWFRDGRPGIIPQTTAFGLTLFGVSLANLTVGFSWSPLMVATGMMMGLRSAASMLLGSTISWAILAPWITHRGIIEGTGFAACSAWLIWPGVGLLLASSFVPVVLEWRGFVRSFRDIPTLLRRRAGASAQAPVAARDRFRLGLPLLLVSITVMLILGRVTFHMSALGTLLGVVLALVLANVCARSAGETDLAPTGAVGTLTQLMYAGSGHVPSLIGGSIVAGAAAQTSQTLWALKAGDRLKASANAQLWAQILGAVVGAIVTVPAYLALTHAYGIGTEAMPAPSALSWKATAEAVGGGLAAMPQYAPLAGVLGFVAGVIFTTTARTRWGRYMPSAAAMGIAVITPFSLSLTAFVGGLVLLGFKHFRPATSEASLMSVAAGGIAGEAVMGVIIAAVIATGILHP